MPHISYSELKDWKFCPFYHKLTRVDKIDGFKGNEYTAFGTAMHSVCEKKLLREDVDNDFFIKELKKNISELDEDISIRVLLMQLSQLPMARFISLIGRLAHGGGTQKNEANL